MAVFPANPARIDPYKNSRFLVYLGESTTPVAEVSGVSCLAWDTQVVSERSGGESNHAILAPGTTTFEPVVLTRGVTQDNAFAAWASSLIDFENGVAVGPSLKNLRMEVRIVLLNEEGQPVIAFILHRCWPSRYQPFGALDAEHAGTLIESLTLQYEGFERDRALPSRQRPDSSSAEGELARNRQGSARPRSWTDPTARFGLGAPNCQRHARSENDLMQIDPLTGSQFRSSVEKAGELGKGRSSCRALVAFEVGPASSSLDW